MRSCEDHVFGMRITLVVWKIHHRRNPLLQPAIVCVPRDSHNLHIPRRGIALLDNQVLAQRIPVSKIHLREPLIHYRNLRRAGPVALLDVASRQNRNLHRLKKARSDRHHAGFRISLRALHVNADSPARRRSSIHPTDSPPAPLESR